MSDIDRYHELEKLLENTHPHSPEFLKLWSELEAIKNRNGGNLPEEEAA